MIVGIVLAGLGAFILLRGLTYGSSRSVMRMGDLQASVEERRTVPPWVGGVAIVGGLILVGTSLRRRRGA
jgi:hypothetical protein